MKPRTNNTYLMRGLTDTTTECISFFAQLCPLLLFSLYLVFLSCPPSLQQQLYRCFIADGPTVVVYTPKTENDIGDAGGLGLKLDLCSLPRRGDIARLNPERRDTSMTIAMRLDRLKTDNSI